MVKHCIHHPNLVCREVACSYLVNGDVVVCRFVRNKSGFSMPRSVAPVHTAVFSKHILRHKRVDC